MKGKLLFSRAICIRGSGRTGGRLRSHVAMAAAQFGCFVLSGSAMG